MLSTFSKASFKPNSACFLTLCPALAITLAVRPAAFGIDPTVDLRALTVSSVVSLVKDASDFE